MACPDRIQTNVEHNDGEIEKIVGLAIDPSPTLTNNSEGFTAHSSSQKSNIWNLHNLIRRLVSWNKSSSGTNTTDSHLEDEMIGVRRLQNCPLGYPRAAAFLDSDENFMIYRRFGFLQARLLLQKQDELRALEENLDYYDREDDKEARTQRKLFSRDVDAALGGERWELMKTIDMKFREYGNLLCLAHKLAAINTPSHLNYQSVKNWFESERPFVIEEFYHQHKEDTVTLKPGRENAWLDGFVETILQKLNCRFIRYVFRSPETRAKTTGREVYFTKKRVNVLVTLIITAMVLVLLIVPVYLLWQLSEEMQTHRTNTITIGILLTFTLIFSAVLSFFTRAQRHEILGAAAAYCAVLVVFISNVGTNANSF